MSQSQIQSASFRALCFEFSSSASSLSVKPRNGVIRAFGLDCSLSLLCLIQQSSRESFSMVEGGSLVWEFALPAIVDFQDVAVDVDAEEYLEVINRYQSSRQCERILIISQHAPRLHNCIYDTLSVSTSLHSRTSWTSCSSLYHTLLCHR